MKSRVCAAAAGFLLVVASLAHAAPVELVVWEHEFPEVQTTLDKVFRDFEAANQNIKIKRAHYKTEDLRSQFQTAAMGGGGADLVLAPNDFAGPFSVMGIIQPVKAWGKLARFDETVVKAVTDANGEVWGLPVSRGNHLMLFVNGKTIKAAPATVEEMVKLAREQTDAGKNRYGLAYNLNEPFWFASFLGAYGEQPLVGGKPQLAGKGMESALALVKDLKFKDKVVPPDCDYACAETLFVEGKTAMLINGDWALQKYQDTLGKDLVIAPLPKLAATGKHMSPMVSGKYLFFNAKLKGDKLEAAKTLAEYVVSELVQERLTKETKRLPSLKSLAQSAVITGDPVLKATSDAMAHGQPMPMEVEMRAVWDAMRPQLQAVMAGRAEPQGAGAVMQKDAETKIKEMR
jgi:arabinogalactan oligomer/maltooligosaccharide transport system substrate-binding protein